MCHTFFREIINHVKHIKYVKRRPFFFGKNYETRQTHQIRQTRALFFGKNLKHVKHIKYVKYGPLFLVKI